MYALNQSQNHLMKFKSSSFFAFLFLSVFLMGLALSINFQGKFIGILGMLNSVDIQKMNMGNVFESAKIGIRLFKYGASGELTSNIVLAQISAFFGIISLMVAVLRDDLQTINRAAVFKCLGVFLITMQSVIGLSFLINTALS